MLCNQNSYNADRRLPTCILPVGLGAYLVLIFVIFSSFPQAIRIRSVPSAYASCFIYSCPLSEGRTTSLFYRLFQKLQQLRQGFRMGQIPPKVCRQKPVAMTTKAAINTAGSLPILRETARRSRYRLPERHRHKYALRKYTVPLPPSCHASDRRPRL